MEPIKLIVLGDPRAQKRHRAVRMGGMIRQYDPSASDKADFLSVVQNQAPEEPFSCPLRVDMIFFFTRPRNHYYTGKRADVLRDNAPEWHTSKSDVDNNVKAIFDALNKVFWRDDSIICVLTAIKKYSSKPRTEITITPL